MKYISLNKFVLEYKEFFPGQTYPTIRKYVEKDLREKKLLGVIVSQSVSGRGKTGIRYHIPVENIQKFIENFPKVMS